MSGSNILTDDIIDEKKDYVSPKTLEEFENLVLSIIQGESFLKSNYTLTLSYKMKVKTPRGALLRSLVFPGWGQFYNRRWIKGSSILCVETITLLATINRYIIARSYYNSSKNAQGEEKEQLYERYKELIRQTELIGWLFALEVVFSMLDAYVDAHLMNYDISDIEQEEWKNGDIKDMKVGFYIEFNF
ncbi:MAG: DUF5683 domain-containing protein [bacterium]